MLKISEINTKQEFYKLKNNWNKALSISVDNHIFLTWEKMATSVDQIEGNGALKILCAIEDGRLIGIAPFKMTCIGFKGRFSYKIIEPLTCRDADYTGLIITEKQQQCLNQFLAHLFNQKDWDLLSLSDLPETSPILELIKNTTNIPTFQMKKGIICPYLTIPSSKENMYASIDKKFEKKLKKSLKKLEREHGTVELKNYQDLYTLEEAFQILIDLHQKRWTTRGNSGNFGNELSRIITLRAVKRIAERGWLRIYFLTVNKKPVAVELNLEYNKKMMCNLKGFDPDYYQYRVGSLLTLKVIENCISRGITEYDFMQGGEVYKFDWTKTYRQNVNISWINNKLTSKIINSGLIVLNKAKIETIMRIYSSALKNITLISKLQKPTPILIHPDKIRVAAGIHH